MWKVGAVPFAEYLRFSSSPPIRERFFPAAMGTVLAAPSAPINSGHELYGGVLRRN